MSGVSEPEDLNSTIPIRGVPRALEPPVNDDRLQ